MISTSATSDIAEPNVVESNSKPSALSHFFVRWGRRLAWLEPIYLLLLGPSILFPGRFWTLAVHPLLVLSLLIGWPIRRVAYGRWSVHTELAWPIGLLMAWLPVTIAVAIYRSQAWIAVGYLLWGIALFWALINWPPARRYRFIPAVLLLGVGLLLALIGPQVLVVGAGSKLFLLPDFYARLGQLAPLLGESVNPNILAGGLVMIAPLALALAIEPRWSKRFWLPAGAGIIALLMLFPLLATQSRGALLAALLAFFVLFLLRWPRLIWSVPILLLLAAYALWRITPAAFLDGLSSDTSVVGLSGRLEIWDRASRALVDFMWTGVGHGLFIPVVPQLYPFYAMSNDIPHAHNLFLQIGVDMGMIGIIGFGAATILAVRLAARELVNARRARRDERPGGKRWRHDSLTWALAAGVIASLSAMLLHGLVDAAVWGTKLAFLPWLVFAQSVLLSSGPRLRRRRIRREERE